MSLWSNSTGLCHQFQGNGTCTYGARCRFSHSAPMTQPRPSSSTNARNIGAFFSEYPQFRYNAGNDAVSEWRRLCGTMGFDPEDREEYFVRKSRRDLRTAMVRQFNFKYGEDASNLVAWQALCREVDIDVPETLHECEEAIKATHVNLVDLTELEEGHTIYKWPTEVALSEYTLRTDKVFPREHAEAGGILEKLLRHITDPRPEWQIRGERPRGGKRGRRRK